MDKSIIGTNAGKIWNTINVDGSSTKHQIIEKTGLSTDAFHAAIGWLARENKIKKDGEFYCLDTTNLSDTIAPNAGKLMHIIRDISTTISQLHKVTRMTDAEVNEAVGWLSREGKLDLSFPQLGQNNDELTAKIQFLEGQLQTFHDDLIARNQIITELTNQLTIAQTNIMNQSAIIEHLHEKDSVNMPVSSNKTDVIKEAQQKISVLQEEIQTLQHDLLSRNEIIAEITKQLTEKQMFLIQQTDTIDHLAEHIVKSVKETPLSTNVDKRLAHIESMDQALRAPPSIDLVQESKRFEHTTPALHFQQESEVVSTDPPQKPKKDFNPFVSDKKNLKHTK